MSKFSFKVFPFVLALSSVFLSAEDLGQIIQGQIQNDNLAQASQTRVNKLASSRQKLLSQYKNTLKEIESTRVYNQQLRASIQAQKEEKKSIRNQIREVKYTDKKIIPLMVEMVDALEQFVNTDIPFLFKERQKRVQKIKAAMRRPDVSTSEKYRTVLEAYQIENEYGRTVDVHQGIETIDGKDLTVNYLRAGRISYIYQTLDGREQAYWDRHKRKWISIPSRYQREVELGFKVASKRVAPDLVLTFLPKVSR